MPDKSFDLMIDIMRRSIAMGQSKKAIVTASGKKGTKAVKVVIQISHPLLVPF